MRAWLTPCRERAENKPLPAEVAVNARVEALQAECERAAEASVQCVV